jgi:hypothetical protein
MGDQRLVAGPHGLPVHAVHVRDVEEIPHLPPALVEDLPPFGPLVEVGLHAGQVQRVLHLESYFGQVDDRVLASAATSIFFWSAEIS